MVKWNGETTLQVRDIEMKIIYEEFAKTPFFKINSSFWPPGIYFIFLKQENNTLSYKIHKKSP